MEPIKILLLICWCIQFQCRTVNGAPLSFSILETAKTDSYVGNVSCSTKPVFTNSSAGSPSSHFYFANSTTSVWDIKVGTGISQIGIVDDVGLWYQCNSVKFRIGLQIKAVNSYAPYFCNYTTKQPLESPVKVNITEDKEVGDPIRTFRVCDNDSTIAHIDAEVSNSELSAIVSETTDTIKIEVKLNGKYDYDTEQNHLHAYTITIKDRDGHTSSIQLEVTVQDFDDHSPAFTRPYYNCSIKEGNYTTEKISCVNKIEALDQDKGCNAKINYTIISMLPSTQAVFTIDPAGDVFVSGNIDREKISSYFLVVKGFQQDSPSDRYNFTSVTMHVEDIDDNPPVMAHSTYNAAIMENTENGVEVLQVAASDPDTGIFGKFYFILNDPRHAFVINKTTGVIMVHNSTLLDYDIMKPPVFNMFVNAKSLNGTLVSDTAIVSISLLDQNDNDPKFMADPYKFHITKNCTLKSKVGQVNATDPDQGTNFAFHIVSGSEAIPFQIDTKTGIVTVSDSLVDRYKPIFNFTIMVEDGPHTEATTRRTSAQVIVFVEDVNMFAPEFYQSLTGRTFNISESTQPETYLIELEAKDKDTTSILNFSIVAGNIGSHFGIKDGKYLYVEKKLDRENVPQYNVTIKVTDGVYNDNVTLTVNILDENDNAPIFNKTRYDFNVTEEKPSGTYVGSVAAYDIDKGKNANIVYTLVDNFWSNNLTVDTLTGNITTKGPIDREKISTPNDIMQLVVIATDSGSIPRSNTVKVFVTVLDINDNMPILAEPIANLTLLEGTGPGVIYDIKVSDPDRGDNKIPTFRYLPTVPISLPKSLPSDMVDVDKSNGTVKLLKQLELTNNSMFSIIVRIKSKNEYIGSDVTYRNQKIFLKIQDVNNNYPVFINKSVNISVPEDTTSGELLGRLLAKDNDFTTEFNTVRYWLDTSVEHFYIDSISGELYLNKELDYEEQTQHHFTVYASDGKPQFNNTIIMNASLPVSITVINTNDNNPVFDISVYNCSVKENTQGSLENCTVVAHDKDSGVFGQLDYSVVDTEIFSVNKNGEMIVNTKLDYENVSMSHTYQVQVKASDGGVPPRTSYGTVTIHLINENDNHPQFTRAVYNFNVTENNKPGQLVGVINATDADGDVLSYTSSNTNFTVDNGFLRVVTTLNYEEIEFHSITVNAFDGNHTNITVVEIHVLPVNEYDPVFKPDSLKMNVTENSKATPLCVRIEDKDSGKDGDLYLSSRVSAKWNQIVRCNTTTTNSNCTHQCTIDPVNREADETGLISVLLFAVDGGTPPRSAVATLTININGVNDNQPYFEHQRMNVTIKEGQAAKNFYTAVAIDRDIGNGSTINYSMRKGNSSIFDVAANGTVSAKPIIIDSSNRGHYTIIIEALNEEEPYTKCDNIRCTQNITVYLQDVNNNYPVFLNKSVDIPVPENTTSGEILGRFVAKDDDFTTEFNTVSYWLDISVEHFYIDSSSGALYLSKELDYENKTQHQFTVYASDDKPQINNTFVNTSLPVMITVVNTNDNAPVFDKDTLTCSVQENVDGPLHDCTVAAHDADLGVYGRLNYTITYSKAFSVNENGTLFVNTELDYENVSMPHTYNVEVKVSDGGEPPRTSTATVIIHLINQNDNHPKFSRTVYNFNVTENNKPGQIIGVINATDADGDVLTYIWDNKNFTIVNGLIHVYTMLNFEETQTQTINVEVSDGLNKNSTVVHIAVLPVNEYDPVFIPDRIVWNVTENSKSSGLCVIIEDMDSGKDGEIDLSASTSEYWSNYIHCANTTNQNCPHQCRIGSVDREMTDTGLVFVQLSAADRGKPPRSAVATLTINITGVNDNQPYFEHQRKNVTLTEGQSAMHFYHAVAIDKDVGHGSVVHYRMTKGNSTLFNVTKDGLVSAKPLWIDTKNKGHYEITVEAINEEMPYTHCHFKNCTQIITINIQDVNNHVPYFENNETSVLVPEDKPTGTVIAKAKARDDDFTAKFNTVSYWIHPSSDHFLINPLNGDIYLTTQLDYENTTIYEIMVYASDSQLSWNSTEIHNVTMNVTINVTDVNDNTPVFNQAFYNCSVKEGFNDWIDDCKIQANDADSEKFGNVTYYITNGELFHINEEGQIKVTTDLDYDNASVQHTFHLQVTAMDQGDPPTSSNTTVTINLLNKNDNPPVFGEPVYNFSIYENNKIGQVIGNVTAMDLDKQILTYNITNKYFNISDGMLIALESFDYEELSLYNITIFAFDGLTMVSSQVIVNILPVNEFDPVIIMSETVYNKTEGGRLTICLNGEDKDKGNDGQIDYTVDIPRKWTTLIQCSNTNFPCNLTKCLWKDIDRDIDETGVINLVFTVKDHGTPSKFNSANVVVNIKGLNDNSPKFALPRKTLYIKEGVAKDNLHTAMASDADIGIGSDILYRLKEGNSSLFSINSNGTVSCKPLWINDRNNGKYKFTVEAYNLEKYEKCKPSPCENGTQTVTIYLQDVNNNIPVFTNTTYSVTIKECERRGSTISRVTAIDTDIKQSFKTVTYWLNDTINDTFMINTFTGEVSIIGLLDYDPPSNQTHFSLTAYASDKATRDPDSNHTAKTNIGIRITDCNDNRPKFNQDVYHCATEENTTDDFKCIVQATDIDKDDNVTYKLLNDSVPFTINTSSGKISLKEGLNYETSQHIYRLIVEALDESNTPPESSCTVIIQVTNINNEKPEFINTPYNFTLYENIPPDMMPIGRISVVDKDGDHVNVTLIGDNKDDFRLSNEMELFPLKKFDYEAMASSVIKLTLLANDSIHTPTASIAVHILDRNDMVPKFNGTFDTNVKENATIGTNIVQIIAIDGDSSANNNNIVSYSLVEGAAGAFEIDHRTGWISTIKRLNASVTKEYFIIVQASDGGKPSLSNITTVRITVDDINDLKPWFLYTPYTAVIKENENRSLLKVYGKDADPSTDILTFNVTNAEYSNLFWFVDNEVHVAGEVNRRVDNVIQVGGVDAEKVPEVIQLNISLTDDKYTVFTMVNVTVIDINDNTPYFINAPSIANIPDTAPAGESVLTVSAKDEDRTYNELTFMLIDDFGAFVINHTTGLISVSKYASFNVTAVSFYNLTVVVQDSGSPPKTNTKDIMIVLNETNAGPPLFVKMAYSFNFTENDITESAKIKATDDEGVTYSIISGNIEHRFNLNSKTGVIHLVNGSLNFEDQPVYSFIVLATDKAVFPKSSTVSVTINVIDVNEEPTIIIDTKTVFKQINSSKGEILKVKSLDPDKKPEYRNLTYSLQELGNNYFDIDSKTGALYINQILDKAGNYSLNVTVTDGGNLSNSDSVLVIVSNITGYVLNAFIQENMPTDTEVYNLVNITLEQPGLTFEMENGVGNFYLKNLIVTVQDVNDNPPAFNSSVYNLTMLEESSIGTFVGLVTATDPDKDPKLSYTVTGSSDFDIDDNGRITVIGSIDRDTMNASLHDIIHLQVTCFDGNLTSNVSDVYIKVKDINDNSPTFSRKVYDLALNESQPLGTIPEFRISASDIDIIDKGLLKYSIVNDSGEKYFAVDPVAGTLKLLKDLDYENISSFNLNVNVTDGNFTDTATINITILDLNDNKPIFQNSTYKFTIPEGKLSLNKEFFIRATDTDSGANGRLTYSFGKGKNQSNFDIITKNETGVIRIISELDRENPFQPHRNGDAIYTLTVEAVDHGDKPYTATATVSVFVTDVNDCPPVFDHNNYTAKVQEGSPIGYSILTVTTTDCDYYSNNTNVTYTLVGNRSDHFSIDTDGNIKLRQHVVESESFEFLVYATDGYLTRNASVSITVLDTNDHGPVFQQQRYHFNVPENDASNITGIVVGTVSAIDDDPGENGRVTYNITSSDGQGLFTIDQNGTITLSGEVDREQRDTYTLIILAKDNAEIDSRQSTCEVKVTITDVNDHSPMFHTSNDFTCFIKEDSVNGTQLKVNPLILATDSDYGVNGTDGIVYSLSGDGSNLFIIDSHSGSIYLGDLNLDRERTTSYQLQVTATDQNGSHTGRNSTATLYVNVTDANDNTPQFVGTLKFSVLENVNTTSTVGNLSVYDADLPTSNKIRFSITSGSFGRFYIDSETGSIHVSGMLDREDQDIYHLNIVVTDGKNENQTVVTVQILDVNDNSPQFNESLQEIYVVEEQVASSFYVVTSYDLDEPNNKNSKISFSLQKENETDSLFYIYENGTLATLQPLDREDKASYQLTIIVKDHGIPQLTNRKAVKISVLDINDNYPLFCNEGKCSKEVQTLYRPIVEKSPIDSVVALPVALDKDIGNNGTVHYSLTGAKNKIQFFEINNATGLVTLKLPVDINKLVDLNIISANDTDNATLEVSIVATDNGTPRKLFNTLALIVTVEKINDDAPVFGSPLYTFQVPENSAIDYVVGKTGAYVYNSTHSHLKYFSVSKSINQFSVDKLSGDIKVAKLLDRETESKYMFPILVRDGGFPERTAFAAVEINVTDINDNSPEFLKQNYTFMIPENTTWDGELDISATDKDAGKNGSLIYSLLDDYDGLFSIENGSGKVKLNDKLDREVNQTIHLTVQVTDQGIPSRRNETTVTINVVDLNDNAPAFFDTPDTVNMTENQINESFQVHAKDADSGMNGKVIYEIIESSDDPFQIDPFTGKVTLMEPLDYEKISSYTLLIQALDQGTPHQLTTHEITVDVIDVYDFIPACGVTENSINSSIRVGTLVATVDAGQGNLRYSLKDGPAELFIVDKMSGEITTRERLHRDMKQYVLSVAANDEVNLKNTTCKVIIHVEDFASFLTSVYSVNMIENIDTNSTFLIDLNTTEEGSAGVQVHYVISNTDTEVTEKFWVEPDTGRLYCISKLDRELHGEYQLYVSAHSSKTRHKRAVEDRKDLGSVKVTVVVVDVNDNPPKFEDSQKSFIGVPGTAKANYLVTKLKTTDADEEVNSKTVYKVVDGDTDIFGVESQSGEIRTLAAVAKSKKKYFNITVVAEDMDNPELFSSINLKIYTVDTTDRLILTVNMSITDFTKKQERLIREMGKILGVEVQLEYSNPHTQSNGSVDLKSTDIYFHGIDKGTKQVIPYSKMLELLKRHEAELKRLFDMQLLEVERVPTDKYTDPSRITVSQIALICMAVFVFFGSLFGILVTVYSWQRLETEDDIDNKTKEKPAGEIELESLRSRHSNRPDALGAFINQAYSETELSSRSLGKAKKAGVQYESQELCLNFDDETTESMLLHNGPVHRDLDASFSMADSGVENTSLHSSDHNKPGSSTGNSNGNGGGNDQKREGGVEGKATKDQKSNSVSTKSNAITAVPVRLLDVGEVPIMTSSPRLGHVDIGFKDDGSSVVVFNRQDSNSETESTTDVLDDKTTSDEPGVHRDDMVRNDDTNTSLETPIKDAITSKIKLTEENRIEPIYSSSLISPAEFETGDNLQRDRASTISFDEIGETNDEHEVTSF